MVTGESVRLGSCRLGMAPAAKRPANEPLTGLFISLLTAQFYLLFLIGPLTSRYQFLKSLSTFIFLLNSGWRFIKEWALGGPGFIFGMSFLVGYRYWERGSRPWAVRFTKKSARAISTVHLGLLLSWVKPMTSKLVFTVSLHDAQH